MPWYEFVLALLLFVVCLIAIFWFFTKWIGEDQLWKDYNAAYKRLYAAVSHWEVNAESYYSILDGFEKIRKFSCRNDEELEVLEIHFLKRFRNYVGSTK